MVFRSACRTLIELTQSSQIIDEIGYRKSRILRVLCTHQGHTLGHISLYEPEEEVLICGDLFHKNDIGWLNTFFERVSHLSNDH